MGNHIDRGLNVILWLYFAAMQILIKIIDHTKVDKTSRHYANEKLKGKTFKTDHKDQSFWELCFLNFVKQIRTICFWSMSHN